MLNGAIAPLLLKMSTPSAIAFLLQSLVSLAEIGFVSQLGTTPLAALALIFPALMLMQMLSNGSIGGAVASSMARTLGNGDLDTANRIVWHAMFIALCAGSVFLMIFTCLGEALVNATGVSTEVAISALDYGAILFPGAFFIWLTALLSSLYRGTGDMRTPALTLAIGSLLQIPLSGALILGWFGLPALGLRGSAAALLLVSLISSLILLVGLFNHRTALRPKLSNSKLNRKVLSDIFQVGAPASVSPLLTVGIVFVSNSLVGTFGDAALAGYGIVSRIEFLLIPLVFGIGAALTALVGVNMGAGQKDRAVRIAWLGGAMSASLTGSIGLLLVLWPNILLDPFTNDPVVWNSGRQYLSIVGPVFAFQGIGFALYFAAQGGGNVTLPIIAAALRFSIVASLGFYTQHDGNLTLEILYLALAIAMVAYGLVSASSLRFGWGADRNLPKSN